MGSGSFGPAKAGSHMRICPPVETTTLRQRICPVVVGQSLQVLPAAQATHLSWMLVTRKEALLPAPRLVVLTRPSPLKMTVPVNTAVPAAAPDDSTSVGVIAALAEPSAPLRVWMLAGQPGSMAVAHPTVQSAPVWAH